jgi:hypothetical protein
MHTTIIIRAEPSDSTCTAIERAEALGAEADQLREEAAQLADAGMDWHHLADAVIRVDRLPTDDWRAMAQFCRGQAHRLSPRQFDFINNIALSRCEPPEKQWRWLRSIFARLGDEP